jgi:hypothetical protein
MMVNVFYFIILLWFLNINSFSQWRYDLQHNYGTAFDISACDTGVVWIVGSINFPPDTPYVFVRTPYQGWGPVSVSGLPVHTYYNCIFAVDSESVWIGTTNGKIYYTSNSGSDFWPLKLDAGENAYVNDIVFSKINKQTGYIFCDPPGGAVLPLKYTKRTMEGKTGQYTILYSEIIIWEHINQLVLLTQIMRGLD